MLLFAEVYAVKILSIIPSGNVPERNNGSHTTFFLTLPAMSTKIVSMKEVLFDFSFLLDFRIRIRPPEAASPDLRRIIRFRSLGSERIRRFTSRLIRTRAPTRRAATPRPRAPQPSWSRQAAPHRHIRPPFIRYPIVA